MFIKKRSSGQAVMTPHTSNPQTQKAEREAGGQHGWQIKFQDRQGYTKKPCLKTTKDKQNKQKCSSK